MSLQTRTVLKGYFETGDVPTQQQFADLIDSMLAIQGSGDGVPNAAMLTGATTILVVGGDNNLYKTTLASLGTIAGPKDVTFDIVAAAPGAGQKLAGNVLQDDALKNPAWMGDILFLNDLPLNWRKAGITYDPTTGTFDFTAYGALAAGAYITFQYA